MRYSKMALPNLYAIQLSAIGVGARKRLQTSSLHCFRFALLSQALHACGVQLLNETFSESFVAALLGPDGPQRLGRRAPRAYIRM